MWLHFPRVSARTEPRRPISDNFPKHHLPFLSRNVQLKLVFLVSGGYFEWARPIQKDARRPYDHFGGGIAPRSPSCVRKRRFPCLKKMTLKYGKMRIQIRGYPGQLGHRRQIAQWSGTRTSHPGGTGFETGPPPKPGSACPRARRGFFGPRIAPQSQEVRVPMPAGAFSAPEYTPQGVSRDKNSVSEVLQAYYCRPLRTKPLVRTRPAIPAIPRIQRIGVIKCRSDPPPSTRAGGQDDVS